MPKLENSLRDWGSDRFAATLKSELEALPPAVLPLAEGVTQACYVDESDKVVAVHGVSDAGEAIVANVGVFFTEIVICCGCGDDPMPQNAYCEVRVRIDKATGEAGFSLIKD